MDAHNFISKEIDDETFIRKDEGIVGKELNNCDNFIGRFNIREKASADEPMIIAKMNRYQKPFSPKNSPNLPKQWLTVSFKEFGDLARALAYVLKKRYNLMPRDKVAILADTKPMNQLFLYALWFLRVTVVEISPKIGVDIQQEWVKILELKMVFYDKIFKPFYEEHKALNEDEWIWEWINPLNECNKEYFKDQKGVLLVNMDGEKIADEILEAKLNGNFLQLKGKADDIITVIGTSSSAQAIIKNGQCSTMKFVPVTIHTIANKYKPYVFGNCAMKSTLYLLAPFGHGLGLNEFSSYQANMGGAIVFRTQLEEDVGLVPEIILDDITEVNAQICLLLPYMFAEFKKLKEQNHPKWPKWDKMFRTRQKGCFVTGGAPVAQEIRKWLVNEYGLHIGEHYGSSEAALFMFTKGDPALPGEEGYLNKLPWIDLYLKPLNKDDENIGELYGHSTTLSNGYLKKLEKNETSDCKYPGFRDDYLAEELFEMIDGRRFYRTKDIFRRSPITGKYKYISRADDIITFSTGLKLNPLPFEETITISCKNVKICSLLLDDTKTEVVCFVQPDWENIKDENGNKIDVSIEASQLSKEKINHLSKLAKDQVWNSIYETLIKESGNLASWAKQLTKSNLYIIKYGEKFPVTEKGSASKRVAKLKYSEVLRDITKVICGEIEDIEIKDTTTTDNDNDKEQNQVQDQKSKLDSNKNENTKQNQESNKDQNSKTEISNTNDANNDLQKMIIVIYESLKEHSISFMEFKDFDPEKSFKYYGVDSLAMAKFTNTLARKMKKSYSPSVIFSYGTPVLLAKFLLNENENSKKAEESIPKSMCGNGFKTNKIAIIGMGLRLPGSIDSESALWSTLVRGKDCVLPLPKDRRLHIGYVDKPIDYLAEGEHNISRCGYYDSRSTVAKPTQFDASFFNCSPEEAIGMDVKHRWILETSWEALESAGISPSTLEDTNTGVFVGVNDGQEVKELMKEKGKPNSIGYHNSGPSTIAGRLSFFYKTYGPSVTVDTACSTGATALHDACRSMMFGDCDLSIVSASRFMFSEDEMEQTCKARMTSPNGRCATFDASADGFAPSEGCVTYILKNLEDAERDNDNILGVILGTSTGQSGTRQSISAPSYEGQARNIKRALKIANVDPSQVSYVEAHGTGTPLGDALEVHGLNQVYQGSHTSENPLVVGSIKTNIGHTCEAAGLAGVAKVLLAMKHKTIPKNIHLNKINPEIELDKIPIKIPTHNIPWNVANDETPRIAQVSSFGLQGSVVNIILQEYVKDKSIKECDKKENINDCSRNCCCGENEAKNSDKHLLIVSAKDKSALIGLREKYESILSGMEKNESVANLCYTTNIGRQHFDNRIVAVGATAEELSEDLQLQLDEYLEHNNLNMEVDSNNENMKKIQNIVANRKLYKSIALICSEGINEEIPDKVYQDVCYLYHTQPVFKRAIEYCDNLCVDISNSKVLLINIIMVIGESGNEKYISGWKKEIEANKYINQLVLLSIHFALNDLLESLGISHKIVIGHQFGEIVAAVLAGKLSLKRAFSLIHHIHRWSKFESAPSLNKMIELISLWLEEPESTENHICCCEKSKEKSNKQLYSCNANKLYKENEELSSKHWVLNVRKLLKLYNNNNNKTDSGEEGTTNHKDNFLAGCEELIKSKENEIISIINISINNAIQEQIAECLRNINKDKNDLTLIPQYSLYKTNEQNNAIYDIIRQLFIKGIEINWNNFHNRVNIETKTQYNLEKVLLPFYPFQRSKYWPL